MASRHSEIIRELGGNWQVLLVSFACLLFAFSAPAFFVPFLYPEVIREFGWTREQAVLLASSKYLTGSIVAIVVGRFIDIIGVRRVLITVSVLGGLALLSLLWISGLAGYNVAGVMLGFSGSGTMVAIKVLVSRTFHAAQGTAMGIALLSTSLGAVLVPFAATWLMSAYGWRLGSALLSAGVWVVAGVCWLEARYWTILPMRHEPAFLPCVRQCSRRRPPPRRRRPRSRADSRAACAGRRRRRRRSRRSGRACERL